MTYQEKKNDNSGGSRGASPSQYFFIFMQLSGKIGQILGDAPFCEILDPPLENYDTNKNSKTTNATYWAFISVNKARQDNLPIRISWKKLIFNDYRPRRYQFIYHISTSFLTGQMEIFAYIWSLYKNTISEM